MLAAILSQQMAEREARLAELQERESREATALRQLSGI